MLKICRFLKNLWQQKRLLADDRAQQLQEGYSIDWSNRGPERYITYIENGREIDVLADFPALNEVVLYGDALRKWSSPKREEVTPFEYQKLLNRVVWYLSCWGDVTVDNRKLRDTEDVKSELTELGIPFT